ncbi:MAG: hypothetical protein L3J45_03880 [Flavobacteriaceae bacterium]|nr:hypothetical protein [Flavobacteriaceae bacterium]
MKKILSAVIVFFILTTNSWGQDKKNLKLNFGLQWNLPERYFNKDLSKFNEVNSGVGLHLYPKWFCNENLSLGLNFEYAMLQDWASTDNISTSEVLSLSPTLNYYFSKNKIRPYAGIGIGLYTVFFTDKNLNIGIRPIIGISIFDRFDLSFEYSKILRNSNINSNAYRKFRNYYVSLKGSYSIGILNIRKINKP